MENINQQIQIPSKKRVYELAKELRTTSKDIMRKLSETDIAVKNHFSILSDEEIEQLMQHMGIIKNDNYLTKSRKVYDIAKELNTTSTRLIEKLREIGIDNKNYGSILSEEDINKLFNYIGVVKEKAEIIPPQIPKPQKPISFYHFHSQRSITNPAIDPNVSHRVQMVYNLIDSKKKEYGDFKKCEIHLHTPASYDYSLHTKFIPQNSINKYGNLTHDGEYKKLSLEVVVTLFSNYNIYTDQEIMQMRDNIKEFENIENKQDFIKLHDPFTSLKEELSYLLIAHQLFENEIQMVVISDHNTIDGFKKLKSAIKKYHELKKNLVKHYVDVLLGVEITCSERNHVIGIFDNIQYEKVERFLKEDLDITPEGTYYPSIYVIEKIFEIGGIAYIAHINSADLKINKPSKIKLFNIPEMKLIGLTKIDEKQKQVEILGKFARPREKEFCFLYEGDAHAVDEIGKKNTWIKFSTVDFNAFKKAIEDYGICIRTEEPLKSSKYIKTNY